jgi:carboxyl-terminal processing protease
MKRPILTLVAAIGFSVPAMASPATELFEQAANYLTEQYFGPSPVNIATLLEKYRVELALACLKTGNAETCAYDQAEPLLGRMFRELEDGHAYYLSKQAVDQENANRAGQNVSPRPILGLRFANFCETPNGECEIGADGEPTTALQRDQLVTRVTSGSPAEAAGIKYGDRLIGYNNTLFSSFPDFAAYQKFRAELTSKVQAGETLTLNFLRGLERIRVDISVKGAVVNLSEQPRLELRPDKIAVLTVLDYQIRGMGQRVHDLVREAESRGAKGIIFEQRSNGGGSAAEMLLTVGAFIRSPEPFKFVPRYDATNNSIEYGYTEGAAYVKLAGGRSQNAATIRNPVTTALPTAVLVNDDCASGCEYFAAYFQRTKRGTIIGSPTAGVGNTNTARFPLINGGAAGMPTVRAFWKTDTVSLPTQITPDINLPDFEYTLFQTGRDVVLEAAVTALNGG